MKRSGVLKWLTSWVGVLSVGLGVLITMSGLVWKLDNRYAKAGEIQQQFNTLRVDVIVNRRDSLVSEEKAILRESRKRALTDLEQERLSDIRRQIQRLEETIRKLGGETP